jgi:hypothetical protein
MDRWKHRDCILTASLAPCEQAIQTRLQSFSAQKRTKRAETSMFFGCVVVSVSRVLPFQLFPHARFAVLRWDTALFSWFWLKVINIFFKYYFSLLCYCAFRFCLYFRVCVFTCTYHVSPLRWGFVLSVTYTWALVPVNQIDTPSSFFVL